MSSMLCVVDETDLAESQQCSRSEPHPDHFWHVNGKRITSVTPYRLQRYCAGRTAAIAPRPTGLAILAALNRLHKPLYQGTVPAKTRARRRAENKRARVSRRINRRNAR